jgi:hypothetical protein
MDVKTNAQIDCAANATMTREKDERSALHSSLMAKALIATALILFGVFHFVGAAKIYPGNGAGHPGHTLAAD